MAGGVFISYRRSDSAASAGRIADYFARAHAGMDVFMDVNTIRPGDDFVATIEARIASAGTVLALIGDRWLDARSPSGVRRLDDPNDFVRVELSVALQRNARVIPVLLDGAAMPSVVALPEPLRPLARRNAFCIRHERFEHDVRAFAEAIQAPPGQAGASAPRLGGRAVAAAILDPLVAGFTRFVGSTDPDVFMVIEDEEARFVQFLPISTNKVLLDLPSQALSPAQILVAQKFLLETYQAQTQDLDGRNFAFQTTLPADPRYLALATLEVFDQVYGTRPQRALRTTIDSFRGPDDGEKRKRAAQGRNGATLE